MGEPGTMFDQGRSREEETIPSRLHVISTAHDVGLHLANHEIMMTWTKIKSGSLN